MRFKLTKQQSASKAKKNGTLLRFSVMMGVYRSVEMLLESWLKMKMILKLLTFHLSTYHKSLQPQNQLMNKQFNNKIQLNQFHQLIWISTTINSNNLKECSIPQIISCHLQQNGGLELI